MVTIYTFPECPYCKELKQLYESNNIEFEEKNIFSDEHKEEFGKIQEICNCDEVPIIRIEKQLFIPNVSFKTITEAVDITKKFLI
jgi:glutaredoxin